MSTYRTKPSSSPPRYRESHRTSAGNLYVTSYDTLSSSGHSGRSTTNSVSSHTSNGPYEVKPVRQTMHADGRRTEYVVRPRHNSTAGQETRRPLSIATTRQMSPRRSMLVAASPREVASAGIPRNDSSRFLQPASSLAHRQQASHHQRHNSTSRTADLEQYSPYRERKAQAYHSHGPEPPKQQVYVTRSQPHRRDNDEAWSYTGPREQFDRDYPQRPRRDSHSRRERSVNAYESDREPPSPRRDHHGPPPSASRQLARIERSDNDRRASRSGFDSDSDRPNEGSRKQKSLKPPAVLHQNRDEGYSSARDDYESRGHSRLKRDKHDDEDDRKAHYSRRNSTRDADKSHRHARDYEDHDRDRDRDYDHEPRREHDGGDRAEHRRKPRSKDSSPDRPHYKDLATSALGGLGGLAAGGTLGTLLGQGGKDKGNESDNDREKHHRRRRRSRREEGNSDESDEHRRSHKRDESGGEFNQEDSHRRHRTRRSHHHDDDDAENRSSDSQRPPRPQSSTRVRTNDDRRGHHYDEDSRPEPPRTISPGENEDDRPRKVMLVEPEKTEAAKPRGILKAPRAEPFPEDPNPIREGVAPLKDATKDGVPQSARWTKINRFLVNPEALEKANERFEEREDYVIVLRVLSREEIQKLADKTAQIRQSRERDWQREIDNGHKRSNGHGEDVDENDQDDRPRLAIEAAPSAPAKNDLRHLTQPAQQYPPQSVPQPSQPQTVPSSQSQTLPVRGQTGNSYPTDDNVGQNYSQNV